MSEHHDRIYVTAEQVEAHATDHQEHPVVDPKGQDVVRFWYPAWRLVDGRIEFEFSDCLIWAKSESSGLRRRSDGWYEQTVCRRTPEKDWARDKQKTYRETAAFITGYVQGHCDSITHGLENGECPDTSP